MKMEFTWTELVELFRIVRVAAVPDTQHEPGSHEYVALQIADALRELDIRAKRDGTT